MLGTSLCLTSMITSTKTNDNHGRGASFLPKGEAPLFLPKLLENIYYSLANF